MGGWAVVFRKASLLGKNKTNLLRPYYRLYFEYVYIYIYSHICVWPKLHIYCHEPPATHQPPPETMFIDFVIKTQRRVVQGSQNRPKSKPKGQDASIMSKPPISLLSSLHIIVCNRQYSATDDCIIYIYIYINKYSVACSKAGMHCNRA